MTSELQSEIVEVFARLDRALQEAHAIETELRLAALRDKSDLTSEELSDGLERTRRTIAELESLWDGMVTKVAPEPALERR